MTNDEIKQLIRDTVTATVEQLKAAGLLRDDSASAYKKTEALLRQYPALRNVDTPYARRVVQEVEACMEEAANDPYVDVIRLFYFAGMTNTACADIICCDERSVRRYRKKLVQQFSVRLASDEFIRELLQ